MSKLYNLARMTTPTTGTGTITLGSPVTGCLSFDDAGVQNGDTVTYAIQDGGNSEIGRGVYTASGTTLTRTVLKSTNSDSAIDLSGTAEVFITAAAEDFPVILDEDDMASDSATAVPSQQSVKAYADGLIVTAAPFDAMAYNGLQVNGFQQISQQNGTSAVTTTGAYPVDEESLLFSGSFAVSAQKVSAPFTSRLDIPHGIEIEATTGAALSAGDFFSTRTVIEGLRAIRLRMGTSAALPISIGRVMRSNISGRGYVSIRNKPAVNRSYVAPFDLAADTDTFVSATINGDTSGTWLDDTGVGLQVGFCFGVGSTFQTTAGAWQAGNYLGASDTTNFMATTGNKVWLGPLVILPGLYLPSSDQIMKCMRQYDDELRACSRYYFNVDLNGFGLNFGGYAIGAYSSIAFPFPAVMRATPILASSFSAATKSSIDNITWTTALPYAGRLLLRASAVDTNCNVTFGPGDYIAGSARL